MIFVDAATGSNELEAPLRKLGLPVEKLHMDSADLMWEGLGPNGSTKLVGVEFKTLNDALSSIRTQRLQGEQVPKMQRAYDAGCLWLVIEGQWRSDDLGRITTYRGRAKGWRPVPGNMMASEFEKVLTTLTMLCGIHVYQTGTRKDSLRYLANLYRWWTDTALDKHTSHIAIYEPPARTTISAARRTFYTLPGIGLKASKAVEEHFGSVTAACSCLNVEEWANITTKDDHGKERRLGMKDAQRIVDFLKGR